jgi:hypothetical protein
MLPRFSLFAFSFLLLSGSAHAGNLSFDACGTHTGDRARFCVQSELFGIYELRELATSGIPLTISLKGTTFDKFDLKNLAGAAPLTVLANNARLGKYDLIEVAQAGATVWVVGNYSELAFGKYDLLELLAAGVKLSLTVDDFKFSQYDLRELAAAGTVRVTYPSSRKLYNKQDLKEILSAGTELYLVVDDATFNKYDLLELARAGLRIN